ncbi:MAG: type I-E CRISPR-associated protein Cse2/CasB [Lachnospiraceae bacterium]|nr:type I-E CRISPR-associated protein Cse2/CasB [Lachnospiraceae bacterium]
MNETNHENISTGIVVKKIIFKINSDLQMGSKGKAELAAFRNSIGKPLNEATEIWPLFFENMPEEFLSNGQYETFEERAVYYTLQLYALCLQGSSDIDISDNKFKGSIGTSLKMVRDKEDSQALDKRFNTLLASITIDELVTHLRHMIKIAKSSKYAVKINFANLANDLYWYQKGKPSDICFRWANDYYSNKTLNNAKEEI